jgi:hypothetical protein
LKIRAAHINGLAEPVGQTAWVHESWEGGGKWRR